MSRIEVRSDAELPLVEVVRMQPGDVMVLHVGEKLTDEEFEATVAALKKQFPGNDVIVLESGVHLSVVRRDGE